ncbi:hypothetical protein ACFC09_15215 [Streptomyces sp. NPDC056161]|uniref:hypothetical protein n=1 Tax=Streptomyces sp. NPDC056161 TaxID=3345732 RepID=UPI0035D8C63B
MTDLVIALLTAVMGAASLAIVLLYKGWKRNRELINELRAQLAAQQIAAITRGNNYPPVPDEAASSPEPVHRKRHLALYLGGGVIAAFATVRDRFRSFWHGHRVLTVTAVATAGTAAALAMAATGNGTTGDDDPRPAASVPHRSDAGAPSSTPGPGTDAPRGGAMDDTGGGSPLLEDTAVNLTYDGQQEHAPAGAVPEPSSSGHAPVSEDGTGSDEETKGPSTPATGQPEDPVIRDPHTEAPQRPSDPEPTKPAGPAVLTVGKPQLSDTDKPSCENVAVDIRNTGGTTATSGTLYFGTHIIGPLGIDWATITQTRELPAPVPAGGHVEGRWTLCVDDWRVPPGWHIDTSDVSVSLN